MISFPSKSPLYLLCKGFFFHGLERRGKSNPSTRTWSFLEPHAGLLRGIVSSRDIATPKPGAEGRRGGGAVLVRLLQRRRVGAVQLRLLCVASERLAEARGGYISIRHDAVMGVLLLLGGG